ncbi:CopD family protein [Micromonospora endolithica]|uniref:CopD family protein n=1 Tax=Micromonospora endolithica TaxID=230091 RepID=UPI001EDFBB1D|nr:CopD family protein [Micromonospora endolithica]
MALLLSSFLLDGHTVTAESRTVMVLADLAHTIADAVWVGGVLLLTVLLVGRARLGVPTGAAEMAVRFSVPATAAVALTGIAGTALTLLILDRPANLVTTSWGRVLLVKVVLVAVVALVGLYNSRHILPKLDQLPWTPPIDYGVRRGRSGSDARRPARHRDPRQRRNLTQSGPERPGSASSSRFRPAQGREHGSRHRLTEERRRQVLLPPALRQEELPDALPARANTTSSPTRTISSPAAAQSVGRP